jgi:hypothetical protein
VGRLLHDERLCGRRPTGRLSKMSKLQRRREAAPLERRPVGRLLHDERLCGRRTTGRLSKMSKLQARRRRASVSLRTSLALLTVTAIEISPQALSCQHIACPSK